jgi:hypothetical protein
MMDKEHGEDMKEKVPVKEFLSRHVPDQLTNAKKLCYRHRPDLIKRRQPDSIDFQQTQRVTSTEQLYKLISHSYLATGCSSNRGQSCRHTYLVHLFCRTTRSTSSYPSWPFIDLLYASAFIFI